MHKMTPAERGSLGGRTSSSRMTPEQRSARGRIAIRAAAVSTIERHWDDMPQELKDRVLARINR